MQLGRRLLASTGCVDHHNQIAVRIDGIVSAAWAGRPHSILLYTRIYHNINMNVKRTLFHHMNSLVFYTIRLPSDSHPFEVCERDGSYCGGGTGQL